MIGLTVILYLAFSITKLTASETCSAIQYDANSIFDYSQKSYKLAIIVPFRDRFEELMNFVPKISKYLDNKLIQYKIYIINQNDNFRFNRASLINIGFLTSMLDCDYIAMHDVDLIPLNTQLDYVYPIKGPYHVSAPNLHPKYHYDKFIGGILLISNNHFLRVNGMSNKFWGWGREDDEFYMRLKDINMTIYRPNNIMSDSTNTFEHDHCPLKRKRDSVRYPEQRKDQFRRDYQTGLDTIQYRIISKVNMTIEKYPCVIINVELYCDKQFTPWCEHKYQFLK